MKHLWQKWRQAERAPLTDLLEDLHFHDACHQIIVYVYGYLKREDLDKVMPVISKMNLFGNFFSFQ